MSIGFPGFAELRRRTIRATPNPLDKSTIVSIFPKPIRETKATLQPGVFQIPSGTYANPGIVIVGPSSWWKDVGEDQPLLEIPNSSIQIAESVVRDYCNGLLACNMSDCIPGLFFIPGEHSITKIKADYKSLLDDAKIKQDNWYKALVKMADVLWSRTNGNPLAISDDMRLAARELNLNDNEWLKDFQTVEMVRCKACGTLGNPLFPVCGNCKAIIDPVKAKALDIQFAK